MEGVSPGCLGKHLACIAVNFERTDIVLAALCLDAQRSRLQGGVTRGRICRAGAAGSSRQQSAKAGAPMLCHGCNEGRHQGRVAAEILSVVGVNQNERRLEFQ
eukprot:10690661-Heterocapsa_arctica.AAC.1